MQNSETILYNLSKNAKRNEYKYERLYRILFNKDLYYKAIAKIYKNQVSGTKGMDDETADGFGEERIEKVINLLKDESYHPKPVRRTYIPKKNSKLRPLGIPSFTDRIIQEICRMIIDTIYEPTFSDSSHGFREGKSCHSALNEIQMTYPGVNWFIEGDIRNYFYNINHQILINILRKRINDERFIRLIWKFLRAGYMENWKCNNTYSGTPQGGIISPLLANIYLNELDQYINKELKPNYDKGKPKNRSINTEYRKVHMRNQRLSKKIKLEKNENNRLSMIKQYKENKKIIAKLPYYETRCIEYKSMKYVRYADDFIIGVIGSKQDCIEIKEKIKSFLNDNLKLELSEEKTFITHSKDFARFVGYDIKIGNDLSVRKDKNGVTKRMYNSVVQLRIPKGTIEKVIIKNNMVEDIGADKWKILHRPALQVLSDLEIVSAYNSELIGLYNYYCMAENVNKKMWQLRYVMEYSCLKTLAAKYRTSIANIKEKYRVGKDWGIRYKNQKEEKTLLFYKGFERILEINNDSKTTKNFHCMWKMPQENT